MPWASMSIYSNLITVKMHMCACMCTRVHVYACGGVI